MARWLVDEAGMREVALAVISSQDLFGKTVALKGPLGAGKTHLVREICRQFGFEGCSSPTFVLSNLYKLPDKLPDKFSAKDFGDDPGEKIREIEHWDLYRLKAVPEELLIPPPRNTIRFIEWADLFPSLAPEVDLSISISMEGDKRAVSW